MKLIISSIFILIFSSCSTARIEQLERDNRDLKSQITDLRGIQAQQSTVIAEIKSQLRSVNGNLEEIQHVSVGKTKELEQTISQLKTRVPPPAGVPEELLILDEEKISTIQGDAADLYRKALQQLRSGDFNSAKESFSVFASENPGTAFTDNALFWLGIANDKTGQYNQAIVSFSEVFQKYPAEDMVAPSLYFLALDFIKIDAKSDAIVALQKLVAEHARTPYGEKGKEQLEELVPSKKSSPAKKGKK